MRKPNPPGQVRASHPAATSVMGHREIPFVTYNRPQNSTVRPEGRSFERAIEACRSPKRD